MTLWFGQFAGLAPEGGYFYLCPSCYQRLIGPHAGEIVHRLAEHHPSARHGSRRGMDAPPPDE